MLKDLFGCGGSISASKRYFSVETILLMAILIGLLITNTVLFINLHKLRKKEQLTLELVQQLTNDIDDDVNGKTDRQIKSNLI